MVKQKKPQVEYLMDDCGMQLVKVFAERRDAMAAWEPYTTATIVRYKDEGWALLIDPPNEKRKAAP